jgi:NAD(P)-dependent dehydrogenase (short-subunit alcohol dehydrogenase family)
VLAERGARIGLTYNRNEARGLALAEALGALARRLDLSELHGIEATLGELARELGGVDALVYCAAVASTSGGYDRLDDVTWDGIERLFKVNVMGALFCARLVASMGGRNVVLVGSMDGVKSMPTSAPYAMSKGALSAMARALGKELGPRGVLVNVVAPGLFEGGVSAGVPEEVRREYLKHCGMKRYATHDEVARTVAWFALENSYVTGQTLVVDGGL